MNNNFSINQKGQITYHDPNSLDVLIDGVANKLRMCHHNGNTYQYNNEGNERAYIISKPLLPGTIVITGGYRIEVLRSITTPVRRAGNVWLCEWY